MTFYICGPGATTCANTSGNLLTGTTSFPNPATLSGGTATSASFTPNAAGTWCFSAVYSGDSNYNGSSDNTGSSNADANECVTVAKGPSTTVTQQSGSQTGPGTILIGSSASDSVTVSSTSSPPGPTPSGTVTFYICGPGATTCANTSGNLLTGTTSFPNPATLSGGTATSASFTPNATGTWCFSAVYSGDSNYNGSSDNTGSSNADANECFLVTTPNFSVTKSDTPGPVVPGATIPYSVLIHNTGNGAGSAVITDALPSNLTLVTSSPAPACPATLPDTCVVNVSGNVLTFTVSLSAGDAVTATFSAVVSASDTTDVVNTAAITTGTCTGDNTCTSTVTNPVTVLSVVKSSDPPSGSTVARGATVTYGLVLTDSGTAAATDVTMTDAVPAGTTYVASSATCGGVTGCSSTEANGTVTWTGLDIPAGTKNAVTVSFQVTVNTNDTNGQTIPNFAVFSNEGTPGCTASTCNTNTVTLTVSVPAALPATIASPPVAPPAIAFTGADLGTMGLAGLALLGLGSFLVSLSRRRRRQQSV